MYLYFRDLKSKDKKSNNDASAEEFGILKTEVPHWSAQVKILDDSLTPISQFEKIQVDPKSASGYSTERFLPPGAYQVQITLEGKTESEWAPVRPNRLTKVTTDAWNDLEFTSAAPIQQIKNSSVAQVNAAEKMSRQLTWGDSKGNSRLFLYIRTPQPQKYGKSFSNGLKLYDENENLITDFSKEVRLDRRQGWLAFNANLPAGGYVLRRGRRGVVLRNQVIYLCPNWQTEVFIRANKYPTLSTMGINMNSLHDGSSMRDSTETAEAVINYLHYKGNILALLENSDLSEDLDELLYRKFQNPWLGVLAAHAILKMEEELQSLNALLNKDLRNDFDEYSSLLRNKLIPFLENTIPMHPDVKTLLVWRNSVSNVPNNLGIESFSFPFPPMLWISLKRIYAYSTSYAHLIPVNSLTDCIIDKPLDDSPWTAWSHLNRYPKNFSDNENDINQMSVQTKSDKISNKMFSVKADTSETQKINLLLQSRFENSSLESDDSATVSPDQAALQQMSVLQTAQSIVTDYIESGKVEDMPEVYSFDLGKQIEQMLEKVDAQAVSSGYNIPLSRIENGLEKLKRQGKSFLGAEHTNFGNAELSQQKPVTETQSGQAIMNFAVYTETQSRQSKDVISEDSPSFENPSVKIEIIFNQLRAGADRLWTIGKASESNDKNSFLFTEKEIKFAQKCALNLNKYADRILRQADFIVNTNQYHQIFKFNDAFRYLLLPTDSQQLSPDKIIEEFSLRQSEWEKALAQLLVGSNQIKDPIEKKNKRRFLVRRLMIEDKQNGLKSYLNIIREEMLKALNAEDLEIIASKLSELTLYTSLFAYGSAKDKKECIVKLNNITRDIKNQLMDENEKQPSI